MMDSENVAIQCGLHFQRCFLDKEMPLLSPCGFLVWVNGSVKSPAVVVKWAFGLYILYVVLLFHINIFPPCTLTSL